LLQSQHVVTIFQGYKMHTKKMLGFTSLIKCFSRLVKSTPDKRESYRTDYSMHDTIMSGLACMYIQSPSLLEFQRRLDKKQHRSNLKTQFIVQNIPKDTQMRELVDQASKETFNPVFKEYLTRLQRNKWLLKYSYEDGAYLLPLDGTQFHSSKNISCEHCLTQEHKNGSVTYSHKVVQAAIVHPDHKQVIPMCPEEIRNEDGDTKQDCEINAAKRLMLKLKKMHPRLKYIRLGDSIYATTPFIKETLAQGDHYIFAVKPGDHTTLFENLKAVDYERHDESGKNKRYVYEWCKNVALTAGDDSIYVNVLRLRIVTPQDEGNDKVTYIGTWITDLGVNESNIVKLVKGARSRWRIENECFNTLKNQGYELKHNYGHGDKNLCFNFYLLTLLAFYIHQILELSDKLFQAVRKECGTLKGTWIMIRSLFNMFVYNSWEAMMEHILNSDDYYLHKASP